MTDKKIPLIYWIILAAIIVAGIIIAFLVFPGSLGGQGNQTTVHPSLNNTNTVRPSPSLHVTPHNLSVSATPLPPIPSPHPTVTYRPTAPFNSIKPTVKPSATPTAKPPVIHPPTPVPSL